MKGVIENWRTVPASDCPWQAPEATGIAIAGKFGDKFIRTSRVERSEGILVTTTSGSVYQLGTPDPEFLAWMQTEGLTLDPENPIKIRNRSGAW